MITSGTSLLHYRVVEKIGEGGMGAVWKATDATLDRDVAIKVLPADFASDTERLTRFEREAKVLASLNHPNIGAIYGFHEAGGVRFLAMELVPGEDLAERLKKGSVPVSEAADMARQIAAALEYAHERGIVHRDLKPANIKITPDGTVKVLDFGLAKAIVGEGTASGATSTPTILPTMTSAGTAMGMILGTAAYMSPEQARGKPVDKRADIWAFGVVLYEMIAGKRLFEGETASDTLAEVLKTDIDLGTLPKQTPASIRSVLRRCLERDPKARLRDIGEARIALESPASAEPEAVVVAATPKRPAWMLATAAFTLVAAGAAGTLLAVRARGPATTRPITFSQKSFRKQAIFSARFAPDGRTIVFSGRTTRPGLRSSSSGPSTRKRFRWGFLQVICFPFRRRASLRFSRRRVGSTIVSSEGRSPASRSEVGRRASCSKMSGTRIGRRTARSLRSSARRKARTGSNSPSGRCCTSRRGI